MSLTPPSALVFDLDGTLVDSRHDIADACNGALAARGLGPLPLDAVLPMVGDGARALVTRALAAATGAATPEALEPRAVDETLASFHALYAAAPCARTSLLPGARDALATGLPNALVTNKPRDISELVLRGLGIAGRFAAVRAGGDGPLKPAPDAILAVLATMGVPPARAWMIGDGPQDVEAGRRAGCFTVAVPGIAERARVLAARPDHVARDLEEVVALVRRALVV